MDERKPARKRHYSRILLKCYFSTFYYVNPDCEKTFYGKRQTVLFCPACKGKANRLRLKGNYGKEHIHNKFNPTRKAKIKEQMKILTSYQIQNMPVSRLGQLGILGRDFQFLNTILRKG